MATLILLSVLIFSSMQAVSQTDTSTSFSDNFNTLNFLNKQFRQAQQEYDTLSIIDIYGYLYSYFNKDNKNGRHEKFLHSQINYIKKYTSSRKPDTVLQKKLFKSYKLLSELYLDRDEYEIAKTISIKMLELCKKLNNTNCKVIAYLTAAKISQAQNKIEEAKNYYKKTLKSAYLVNDYNSIYISLQELTAISHSSGEYMKSITYLYESLDIVDKLDDHTKEIHLYNQIAHLFLDIGLYEKANEYINKSISINSHHDVSPLEKGYTYQLEGDIYNIMQKRDEAIISYKKALKMYDLIKDNEHRGAIFSKIGQVYVEQNEFEKANNYLKKSMLIRKKMNINIDIADSYMALGQYYYKIDNIPFAKYYFLNSFKIAKKIFDVQLVKKSSEMLYEILKKENNYEEALKYLEEFKISIDSLIINKNNLLLERLEVEQESKRYSHAKDIKINNLLSNRSDLILLLSATFTLLIIVVLLSIFFIKKSKTANYQKQQIQSQQYDLAKQYEKSLMLSQVIEHTNNSIFIMNPQGKLIWVNNTLLELYNITREYIFEEKDGFFENLSYHNSPKDLLSNSLKNDKICRYVNKFQKDGKTIYIHTEISPIFKNGKLDKLVGIETDITFQKEAELKIEKQKYEVENKNKLLELYNKELKQQQDSIVVQNEELKQQKEELQAHTELLQSINIELKRLSIAASETDNIIYIFNIKGKLEYVNNSFLKYTGYTYDEYVLEHGDNILESSTFPNISDYFNNCIKYKKSVKYVSTIITKNNKTIWVQTTLTPIMDKDGNTQEIIVVDSDISDIKEAEHKVSMKNKEIRSSLEYASRIQRSVLPLSIFVGAIFEKYFIYNKPRDIVSGDFYFIHYYDEKALLAVADCTGHGIPGAFMSLIGTMAFKIVMSKISRLDLNLIMKLLNSEIMKLLHQRGIRNDTNDSIDTALCIFDFENNIVEYAGANIPIFISKKNIRRQVSIERIKATKATIGQSRFTEPFKVHTLKLNEGDRIYMSSDGFLDQFGGEFDKKLKRRRFIKMLEDFHDIPYHKLQDKTDKFLHNWMGTNQQVDDILLIGVEM